MAVPDLINGVYESLGGLFILISVLKIRREQKASGVSWIHQSFFSSWGLWNCYYYPSLDQWFSFCGGVFLVAMNIVWTSQICYYTYRRPK